MPPTPTLGLLVPAAFLAALALPSATAAQYRLPTITTVATADSLHKAAVIMAETTYRWRDAASLHRQSAGIRTPEDTMAYHCLATAAHLSFAAKDLAGAQRDMTAAAERAMARGDVVSAAHALADAAWVAKERKHPEQVWKLGRQAEVLASSPLLSSKQRVAILGRFVRPQRDFAKAKR